MPGPASNDANAFSDDEKKTIDQPDQGSVEVSSYALVSCPPPGEADRNAGGSPSYHRALDRNVMVDAEAGADSAVDSLAPAPQNGKVKGLFVDFMASNGTTELDGQGKLAFGSSYPVNGNHNDPDSSKDNRTANENSSTTARCNGAAKMQAFQLQQLKDHKYTSSLASNDLAHNGLGSDTYELGRVAHGYGVASMGANGSPSGSHGDDKLKSFVEENVLFPMSRSIVGNRLPAYESSLREGRGQVPQSPGSVQGTVSPSQTGYSISLSSPPPGLNGYDASNGSPAGASNRSSPRWMHRTSDGSPSSRSGVLQTGVNGEGELDMLQRVPQPLPPMLASADQHSITLEWGISPHYACYYLDMAPERSDHVQKGRGPKLNHSGHAGRRASSNDWVQEHHEAGSGWPEWVAVYCGKDQGYKLNNLKPGRKYLFRLRVVPVTVAPTVPAVAPPPSLAAIFATLPGTPDPPPAPVLVTRMRGALKLKWFPPIDTGGMSITGYRLEVFPPPGKSDGETSPVSSAQQFVEVYDGDECFCRVTRLVPGVEYSFRVQAVNCIGRGDFSPTASFFTAPSVPAPPLPPTPREITSTSITVEWQEPACCGSNIACYTLEIDQDGTGSFIPVYTGEDLSCEVRGLRSGALYRFRVTAENDIGRSSPSYPAEISTEISFPQPPSMPAVSNVHAFSANMTWKVPLNNGGSPVLGYSLEVNHGVAGGVGDEWLVAYEGPASACSLGGLRSGTPYRVRVRAQNVKGESEYSGEAMFITSPAAPGTPGSPTLVDRTCDSLTISWSPSQHNGGSAITAYRLEMQPLARPSSARERGAPLVASEGRGFTCAYVGPDTEANIGGLRTGATYGFRVQALNKLGPSLWSPLVILETQTAPPGAPDPPVLAFSCTSSTIPLRWTSPDANGSQILGYRLQMWTYGYGCRRLQEGEVYPAPSCSGSQGGGESPLRMLEAGELGQDVGAYIKPVSEGQAASQLYGSGPGARSPAGAFGSAACPSANWEVVQKRGRENAPLPANGRPGGREPGTGGPGGGLGESETSGTTSEGDVDLDSGGQMGLANGGERGAGGVVDTWQDIGSETSSLFGGVSGVVFEDVYHGPALAHTVSRLLPHTTYVFRVQALSKVGAGPMSQLTVVMTAGAAPWAPQPPAVLQVDCCSVHLQWEAPERDNGANVTSFTLQMARGSSAPESLTDSQSGGGVGGRELGVLSRRAHSIPSSEDVFSAETPVLKESSSSGSVSSTGSFGTQSGGGGPASWKLVNGGSRRRLPSTRSASLGNLAGLGGGPTEAGSSGDKWEDVYSGPALDCVVADLASGQRYLFRVQARNSFGISPGSAPTVALTDSSAPMPPAAPQLSNVGPTSLRLKWGPPLVSNGAPVTSYQLSTDDGKGGAFRKVYEGGATSFRATRLIPARTYCFQVQAINCRGCSSPSEVASITLPSAPPLPPPAPEVLKTTSHSISIKWSPPIGPHSPLSPWTQPGSNARQSPRADENLSAASSNRSSLDLEGSDREEGCLETVSYTLAMDDRSSTTSQFIPVYEGQALRFVVKGLQPGHGYRFQVRANGPRGSDCSSWSPITLARTEGASASASAREVQPRQVAPRQVASGTGQGVGLGRRWVREVAGLGLGVGVGVASKMQEVAASSWEFMRVHGNRAHSLQYRRYIALGGTLLTLAAAYYAHV